MRLIPALLAAVAIHAQAAYPEKPIRFIIPSAPGGSPDVLMRILLAQMSQQMGVAFVVEGQLAYYKNPDTNREVYSILAERFTEITPPKSTGVKPA